MNSKRNFHGFVGEMDFFEGRVIFFSLDSVIVSFFFQEDGNGILNCIRGDIEYDCIIINDDEWAGGNGVMLQ